MYHNPITSNCITPTETPLAYAMFHNLVFRVNKERIVVTPEMFGMSLLLNYEDRTPETWEEMKEIVGTIFPKVKFNGCVAREDHHSIQLWHDRITIYKPTTQGTFGTKYELSRINWSAIGSTDIEETETFAKILAEAVYIARELDKEFLASIQ